MGGTCETLEVGVRVLVGERYGVDFFDVTLRIGDVTQRPYREDPCKLLSTLGTISERKSFVFHTPKPDTATQSAVLRLRTAHGKKETLYSAKVYIRRRGSREDPETATGTTVASAHVFLAVQDKDGGWTFLVYGDSAKLEGF